MKGKITKHHREIYYVNADEGLITARARGLFRKNKIRPMVGDWVTIRISEEDGMGYIEEVLDRKNSLIRPQVANVDLAVAVYSIKKPNINTYLVDKNLLMSEFFRIDTVVVLTKTDLVGEEEIEKYKDIYQVAGYQVYQTSMVDEDFSQIRELLDKKISVLFGPSGVGKTTLINSLNQEEHLTAAVSQRTGRGKHTTRHIELIEVGEDSYILDTPGFSTLDLDFFEDEFQIEGSMREFKPLRHKCRFHNCLHLNEPGCGVKDELGQAVPQSRYDSYVSFIDEFRKIRRY